MQPHDLEKAILKGKEHESKDPYDNLTFECLNKLDTLNYGAQGIVYRCQSFIDLEFYALKIQINDYGTKNFESEKEIMKNLKHPNVVGLRASFIH